MIEPVSVDAKLIDMTRIGQLNNPLTRRRWIVKDLAQFWYSTQSVPVTQQQRRGWLEAYCATRGVCADQLIGPIQKKAAAIARHDAKLRVSQPRRNVSIGDAGKPISRSQIADLKSSICVHPCPSAVKIAHQVKQRSFVSQPVLAVVSVLGKDQKGVVAQVATYMAERGINIEDIEQRVVRGLFVMDMLVDLQTSPAICRA